MFAIQEMKDMLEKALPPKRFKHSLGVYETALKMAEHDCGREVPTDKQVEKAEELGMEVDYVERRQPILLHAKMGAYFAEHKYGITDPEILEAIRLHSTGAPDMTELDMVVYLADLIEPGRDFDGVEKLRKVCFENLEKAMVKSYANTIEYLLDNKLLIHPDCIFGYNQLIVKLKK